MGGFPYRVGFQGGRDVANSCSRLPRVWGFKGSFRQWEGLLRIGD